MFKLIKSRKFIGLLLLLGMVTSLGLNWLFNLTQPSAASTTANDLVPAYNDRFRFGTNLTWRNPDFSDAQLSDLAAANGLNSLRVSLPENYLDSWGYDIALANMQHYQSNNLLNLTATLGSPASAHSKAPTTAEYWQLDYYSPANLYQPIWNADGSINPNNYWANYVYKAVSIYKPYIKIWEIWNEPDYTQNWNATQTDWWNNPPKASDLERWNDSLFSYVRLLRVSYEVIKRVDPTALVATGGLGYESFLDAVLRYTDNPVDGAANASYPLTGGAYFDVLSYHYYPQYGALDLATGKWNTNTDSDNGVDNFITYRNNYQLRLAARGYNNNPHPAKQFISTETGTSSQPVGSDPGSMELLRNYQMKLQVMARVSGLKQVQTFELNDMEPNTTLNDSYNHMGLYYDIQGLSSPAQATRKAASYGIETMARTLEGATYDAATTATLNLPAGVRGAVFRSPSNQRLTVLWARTANNSEAASLNYALPASTSLKLRNWQWAQTKAEQTLSSVNGQVQLSLSAAPLILIGDPAPVAATNPTATPTRAATATAQPQPTATSKPLATTPPPTVKPNPTATSKPSATVTSVAGTPKQLVATLSASGSDAGHPASSAGDGNTNSYWAISGNPATGWIQLDLGASKQVSEIRYFVFGTSHAPSTKIQYSSDGSNWTTLPNADGIDTGAVWGWNSIKVGPVNGRYVRFLLSNPNLANWELGYYAEIQIWGQ